MINFDTGSTLADFQQNLFDNYVLKGIPISSEARWRLQDNYWIKSAETLAPCNLVVRHYVLIDIANGNTKNYQKITNQLSKLTYSDLNGQGLKLYAEGYSYWLYIKQFLSFYGTHFSTGLLNYLIDLIDRSFQNTSYSRNGILYPAPFADVRDTPLEMSLQNYSQVYSSVDIFPVQKIVLTKSDGKNIITYKVTARKIGLNGHVQSQDSELEITPEGFPVYSNRTPYKFYTGYNDKYPTFIDKTINIFKRFF